MPLPRLLPPLAVVAALAVAVPVTASPAVAAPVSVTADDGTDSGARGPGSDIQQVRTTFDAEAGTWSVTVRFFGPMSSGDWAMANATISTPSSDRRDCTLDNKSFGWVRTSTKPGTTTLRGAVGAFDDRNADGTLGEGPWEQLTRSVSADGRELTVAAASPRLIGREPGCVTVTMSYNGMIDTLTPGAVFATRRAPGDGDPGTPDDGGPGGGPREPGDPGDPGDPRPGDGAGPLRIRLAPRATTLRAPTLGVRLAAFPVAVAGSARLTAGATTLARASWTAKAGRTVRFALRRTPAGRRWIRRHPRARVRLHLTARAEAGAPARRVITLRLRA